MAGGLLLAPAAAVAATVMVLHGASGTNVVYPFTPGVAIPAKGQVSILYNGPAPQVRVEVLGYTVPTADAPGYTTVLECTTAASACGA